MKKALIIGGGFGGCTAVHELSRLGSWDITLAEPSSLLGGGVRTRFKSGHPYTFGPRHFLTQNNEVFIYLRKFLDMRICNEHQFTSYVADDSNYYNYPIHYDDITRMPEKDIIYEEINNLESIYKDAEFRLTSGDPKLDKAATDYEDFWIKSVGPTLYKKFIETYTKKMWMIDDNKKIDDFSWSPKGVALKYGPREGWDTAISAYPTAIDGYNKYFDSAKEKCHQLFNGLVEEVVPNSLKAKLNGEYHEFDIIVNTAPLDDIFGKMHGELLYIGRKIEFAILPIEFALPKNVYFNYFTGNEPYTRIVEYKKFSRHQSPHTLISLEYPTIGNGKYYPMPMKEYRDIHKLYLEECNSMMFNAGRISKYNYRYDIDDVIEQVLEITKAL